MNRKGYHSLNVQIVCNANMEITNINARYPGSTHDSFIFLNSRVYTSLERLYEENRNEWNFLLGNFIFVFSNFGNDKNIIIFITGDSGYPLLPFLMNVFQGNDLTQPQRNFNFHTRTIRQLVERTIGVLKMRFRCINGERALRYRPTKASKIVYACATLHNYLLFNRFDILHGVDNDEFQNINNPANVDIPHNQPNRNDGIRVRNQLVEYFNRLI